MHLPHCRGRRCRVGGGEESPPKRLDKDSITEEKSNALHGSEEEEKVGQGDVTGSCGGESVVQPNQTTESAARFARSGRARLRNKVVRIPGWPESR
jgi:hypothetical protein